MKTYAYVTSENCAIRRAFLPGDEYKGEPVSRHGDLSPWRYGKRETAQIAKGKHPVVASRGAGYDLYMMATARKVLDVLA